MTGSLRALKAGCLSGTGQRPPGIRLRRTTARQVPATLARRSRLLPVKLWHAAHRWWRRCPSPTFAEIRAKSKIYNKFCRLISHNPLRCNGRTFSGSFVVPIAYLHYRNVCYFNLIWSPVKLKKAPAVAGPQAPPGDDDQGVIDGVLAQSVSHTYTTSLGPVLAGLHF